MAQADGYIIIDTEINADGMKAGSREVEAAVRRMANSVEDMGSKAKTALNKQADSFSKLNQEYAAQERKVSDLKKKVAEYGEQKIPTEEYREIQTQIDRATQKLSSLESAQERFLSTGGKKNSSSFKKMQYDIEELENEIKYAKAELADLEASGGAFTLGSKTQEAAADMERLVAEETKLANMNNRLQTSYDSLKETFSEYSGELSNSYRKAIRDVEKEIGELEKQGLFFGDEDYDAAYIEWQRLIDKVKAYKQELATLSKVNPFDTNTIEGKLREAENELAIMKSSGRGLGDKGYDAQIKKVAILKEEYKNYLNEVSRTPSEIEEMNRKIEEVAAKEAAAAQEAARLRSIAENAEIGEQSIVDLNRELEKLKLRQAELSSAGIGFGYEEFDNNTRRIAEINEELKDYKATLNNVSSAERNVSEASNKVATSVEKVGREVDKASKKTSRASKNAQIGMGKMLKTAFIMNMFYRAMSVAMNAIKDGFTNLAQYSSSTNNSISMLWGSLETLKNSLATAFAPILNIVAPILSKFIDMLSTAASYVSMFFSFLSGKSTYTKAIAVQKDYAGSLKDTASGAKDAADGTKEATEAAEEYLSPLDDINRMDKQDSGSGSGGSGGGGGAGGGSGSGPLFEEVPIDNKFASLLDSVLDKLKQIRDIFMSGFWDGLGDYKPLIEELKKDLNSISGYIRDIFADRDVQAAAKNFARKFIYNLGKIAGAFVSIGLTIAVNIVGGIESYLAENVDRIKRYLIRMFDIGAEIMDLLGTLAATIAEIFAQTFGSQTAQNITGNIIGIFATAFGLVSELVASFRRDLINFIVQPIVDNKEKIITAINGLLAPIETITQGIETFLHNVADGVTDLYDNHIAPFFQKLTNGFSMIVGALLDVFNNYIAPVLSNIATLVSEVLNGPVSDAIGQALALIGKVIDLLGTLWESVLAPFISWQIETILPVLGPIFEWVATTFINLFGTVSQITAGILEVLNGFLDFFKGVFTDDATLTTEGLKAIAEGLKKAIVAVFAFVKDNILTPFSNFLEKVFRVNFEKTFGLVGMYMESWGKTLKDIVDSVKQIFQGIIDFVTGVFSSNWSQAWNGVKEIFSGIWGTFAGIVKSPINAIIGFINQLLYAVERMQHGIANALNAISIDLPGWVQDLTGYSSFGFNIGYISTPRIPYLAQGAVIPPNKEFMAVLGDQKSGNNIEAPESLIRKIVREETGNSSRKIEVPVYLNRRQIAKAVLEEGKNMRTQTGRNPFEMA
jgi:predicted  nucleic acid-binding Zn-ribbon protein